MSSKKTGKITKILCVILCLRKNLSKIKYYEVERAKSERNSAIKIFADYVRNKGFNLSENQKISA